MTQKWVKMTEGNPLSANLLAEDEKRLKRRAERKRNNKIERMKYDAVDSMIGTAKFDWSSKKEVMDSMDEPELRLALQLRKHTNDKDIVAEERLFLNGMLAHELVEVSRKFSSAITPGLKEVAATRERAYINASSSLRSSSNGRHLTNILSGSIAGGRSTGAGGGVGASGSYQNGDWESVAFEDGTRGLKAHTGNRTAAAGGVGSQTGPKSSSGPHPTGSSFIHDSPQEYQRQQQYEQQQQEQQQQEQYYDESSEGNSSAFRGPGVGLQRFEEDLDKEFGML